MNLKAGQHLFLGIEGPQLTSAERQLFEKIQPGGYILFSRNIGSATQVRALTKELRQLSYHSDPLIGIDQEGGLVSRLLSLGVESPSAKQLVDSGDSRWLVWHAKLTAVILRTLGVNYNFAPVVDIAYEEKVSNSLVSRCFGGEAAEVLENAGMYAGNLRGSGVLNCAKHFPSVGRAKVDPHEDLPIVETSFAEMYSTDLLPYNALVGELDSVMTAHVLYPELDTENPASLSDKVIREVLREHIGFEGMVITDDLDMGAITKRYSQSEKVIKAIQAGNDMAMICHDLTGMDRTFKDLDDLLYDDVDYYKMQAKRVKKMKAKIKSPLGLKDTAWDKLVKESRELMKQMGVVQQLRGDSFVNKV